MLYDEERIRARSRRRKKQRTRQLIIRVGIVALGVLAFLGVIAFVIKRNEAKRDAAEQKLEDETLLNKYIDEQPTLDVQLIDVNKYSRPGLALEKVNGIVIHYTANPGTTAQQNRDYFQSLASTGKTYASSHFIVGLDGEIIQCIPCNEMAYASNERNSDTIAIECCIEDESGKFNGNTYESVIKLTSWLMGRYDLNTKDVIRHYDITGKACPKYFVDYETAWDQFHQDLVDYIEKNGVDKP